MIVDWGDWGDGGDGGDEETRRRGDGETGRQGDEENVFTDKLLNC
jgi:hypothetical protein